MTDRLREIDEDAPAAIDAVQRLLALGWARRREWEATGNRPNDPLRFVITGNAGTGKTTAAKILGRLLHALGLLPSAKVVVASAPSLIGEQVGATKARTNAAIQAPSAASCSSTRPTSSATATASRRSRRWSRRC